MTVPSDKFFVQAPEQLVPSSTGFGHADFNATGTVEVGASGSRGEVQLIVDGTWSYATLQSLGNLLVDIGKRYREANIAAQAEATALSE